MPKADCPDDADAVAPVEDAEPHGVVVTRTATGTPTPLDASKKVLRAPIFRPRDSSRYQIIAEHGRGGLGRVVRAHDNDLARDVAIKEVLSTDGIAEARFVREAIITARLEHPNIVPVHDAGRWEDGTPFYAMKLVAGRPLKELIEKARSVTSGSRSFQTS